MNPDIRDEVISALENALTKLLDASAGYAEICDDAVLREWRLARIHANAALNFAKQEASNDVAFYR